MDIKDSRKEIDSIDAQLVKLFSRRMELSGEIAQYKKENNLPVFDRGREREIFNKVTGEVKPEFSNFIRVIYQSIFDVSRTYQNTLINKRSSLVDRIEDVIKETPKMRPERAVVACQGVEGAYSQHACEKMFKYPSIMYFSSFEDVFKAVSSGLCRYGVLPIENSTAGSVQQVYDLMGKYHFFITHSTKLYVSHTLLTKGEQDINKINEVYSHEQAINQCSNFISKMGYKVKTCANTAEAARLVALSDRDDIASIGSVDCAEQYNLKVVANSIQNNQNNYTRFICISKDPEIYPGAKKTSFTITLSHKPGALYTILSRFASLGLNLTKLESRAIPGSDFEFMFYFDIDESVYSPELLSLITDLKNSGEAFTYLGSYTED